MSVLSPDNPPNHAPSPWHLGRSMSTHHMDYSSGSPKVMVLASDGGDGAKNEAEAVHLPQPTNDVYIPPSVSPSPIGPKDKELPLLPTVPHHQYGIFTENAPKPAVRSSTPTSPQARMDSTLQLVFCARLLAEDCYSSTLKSSAAKVCDLDDAGREWLDAAREDPSALARIHWLVSRLVAEFVKDPTLGSNAISEVVLLGPVLCQVDYRALLSSFIERFDQAALHNEALLQGMIQLLQSAPTRFIADDDLIRIVEVIRKRLKSTHVPSKDHVYQLVVALSKVLEVMVGREGKGLSRQQAHQLLVAALRSLKGVEDDEFLKFQINYAYQTSLSLPDDKTSFRAFLRYAESLAVDISAVASVFKLDPESAPDAMEHPQQVAGNAIDVIKFNHDGTQASKATSECASQAVEKAYWSAKKQSWFLTLQEAYAFVREGLLVDFNQLICNATCRLDPNFLQGIFLILGKLAVDPLWDIQTRLRAIDFLGEIFGNEPRQGQNGRTAIWITSVLTQISTMGLPNISDHARLRLRNLGQGQSVGTKDYRLLFTPLSYPASSSLLERALDIEQVHYTLDCMRFQRLQGFPHPFSIPLFAKATLTDFDNCSFLLMKRVLEFLDSDNRVFLLLGDSGSGKSTFCRQLELELWNRYDDGSRVPLYINLPSINKPHCDLIEKHLRRHHNILDPIIIQEIKRDRQFILICDGYDESRLTANIYVSNQLHQLKAKMVIACRNTFLSREYQGYFRPHGDNNYDNKLSELFEEATIVPFTESDIKDYVSQHVLLAAAQESFTALSASSYDDILKKLNAIPNLMNLVSNPFLLTLALSALPSRSIEALQDSELEAMQQDLYDGFFRQWVHLGQKRLQGTKLKQDVRTAFDKLSDDFFWYVRDYSKRLAHAIYSYQGGRPVVKVSRKHKEKWKDEFFGPGIETTLLRETSPLTRAGIRHWFIHKSLLDYFFSLCAFDPDDSDDYDSDDDDDEHWGGGDESRGGGGNSFGGDGDGLMNDNGGATDGDGGAGSTGNNSGSSGGGSGFSGGNEGSSNDHDSSANENHDSASNGGAGNSNSNGGSSGDGGDGFHGDKNGSNGNEDGSRRRKDDVRSKRKANSTQSRSSASSDSFSKWNFFKEPSVLQFLVERARSDPRLKKRLFSAIKRAKSSSVPSLAAANAITILFKSGERFQEMDLNGVHVPGNYLSTESAEPNFHAECSLTGRELVRALIPPPVSIQTPAIAAPMPFSTTMTLATPTASLETRLLDDDKIESIHSFEVVESGGIHIPSKCVSLETAEPLLESNLAESDFEMALMLPVSSITPPSSTPLTEETAVFSLLPLSSAAHEPSTFFHAPSSTTPFLSHHGLSLSESNGRPTRSVYHYVEQATKSTNYTISSMMARSLKGIVTTGARNTHSTQRLTASVKHISTTSYQQISTNHPSPAHRTSSAHRPTHVYQQSFYKPRSTYKSNKARTPPSPPTSLSPTSSLSSTWSQVPSSDSQSPTSSAPTRPLPNGRELSRDKSLPSIPSPHQKLPKADRLYQDIFSVNVPRPPLDLRMPSLGSLMESTAQLALCRRLLLEKKGSGEGRQLTQAQRTWLEAVKNEESEQEHIHDLVNGVLEEFITAPIKDSTVIAEILLIAPTLDKEHYRKLLNEIIDAFGQATLQDTYLLQGLVQLVRSASDGYLHEDDFVRVLEVLRKQLQNTHLQSSKHPFHLTVAVSRVLDVMAECKVENLDRVSQREPLLEVLKVVQESDDPYLLYQASYAFQALQYVPDEESALQTVLCHSGAVAEGLIKVSGVVKLDMGNLFDGLEQLQKTLSDTYDAVKSGFKGARSLVQSGRGLFDSLKQGLGSGSKRPWYPALRAADDLVRDGRLYDLKSLILEAPCRHEPEFQWGISQLLGDIAGDRAWSNPERQQAATFLIYLLECGKKWTKDDSVRLWMLTILRHLKKSPDGIIMGEARERLDVLLIAKDDVLYDSFPLVDTLPTSTSLSPLLDRVQPTADVEYTLSNLRRRRIEEYRGTLYISPNAKSNLLEQDKASFPLMPKVNLFLKSERLVFLLLGDSGAGKSMFNRHLEYELWVSYKKGGRIPLHINLPAIPKPDQDLITKQLTALDFTKDQIIEMMQTREFTVICDGYDESQLQTNLYGSNSFNHSFNWKVKMIISCRSTYLPQDYRGRFEPVSSDKYATPLSACFQEAVIVPFSSDQIKEYIGKFVHRKDARKLFNGQPVWDVEEYMKKLESIPNMMELVKNPFLLMLSMKTLPSVYKDIPDITTVKATRLMLYDRFIDQWIQDSQRRMQQYLHMRFSDVKSKFDELVSEGFSEAVMSYAKNLAVHIVTRHENNPFVLYSTKDRGTWKDRFFGHDTRITILREASPMTRVGNQHRFIHRSLVEYFYSLFVSNPEPDETSSEYATFSKPFEPVVSNNIASTVAADSGNLRDSGPEAFLPARTSSPLDASSSPRTTSPAGTSAPVNVLSLARTPSPVDPSTVRDPAPSRPMSLPPQNLPSERTPPPAPVATPSSRSIRKPSLTLPNPSCAKFLVKDPSTLQFLAERLQQDEALKQQFYATIERSKSDPSVAVDAANAITALVRAGERFNGFDLSGARIPGADVSGGDFDSVRLAGADLTGANLTRAWFRHANFVGAQMRDVQFGEWPYLQMKSEVNICVYSPNGHLLAIGFSGGAISLINTESWLRVRDLAGHDWTVTYLSFSPDNAQLVSASEDKLVKVWNVKTGALEHILDDQSETVACIIYSPDGARIAAASHDSTVRVYNRPSMNVALELKGHTGAVKSVTYSPSGNLMATASYDWTVRLWDPKTGLQRYVMRGHTAWVTSVSISPTNNLVASSGQDMTVRMWNGTNGMPLYILKGHTAFVKNVSFSPSGHQLASGSGDNTVRLWDGVTGTPGPVLSGHTQSVVTLSFSPVKAQITTGSWDSTVRLWDTSASALLSEQSPSVGSVEDVSQSSPSNDLNQTLSGGHSSSSSLDMGPAFATAIGINSGDHTFSFSSVACSSDGQLVATCSIDLIRLYNANTGAFNVSLRGHDNSVTSLAFSYDSTLLVSGSYDKTARVWNVQTGEGKHVLYGHTEAVTAVAFSPTGSYIATGSDDRLVKVWSARTGKVYRILQGHTEVIKSLVFSPNHEQSHLASGSGDNNIKLWHARDGSLDRDLKGHSNAVESVSFTSDGKRLASGSRDGTARIWDVSAGQITRELTGVLAHKSAVTAIAFSPNNLRLATGSWDKTVKIWDVQTGKCLVTVEEFVGEVNSIAWKPLLPQDHGSMCFVTGCADKSVRMWKLVEPVEGPHRVELHWRSAFDGLMVKRANVQGVVGLSRSNEKLLEQRGTIGEPRWF